MRVALWAAMAGVAALAVAGAAHADAIYDFVPSNGAGLSAELVISDAAVQRGSFALTGAQAHVTGDASDFRSLSVGIFGTHFREQAQDFYASGGTNRTSVSFGSFYGFNLAFTFDGAGDVTSSVFRTDGPSENVRLAGSGDTASGALTNDFGCAPCSVSGAWADLPSAVPEPPMAAVLGLGLVGLAAARSRRISTPHRRMSHHQAWQWHDLLE